MTSDQSNPLDTDDSLTKAPGLEMPEMHQSSSAKDGEEADWDEWLVPLAERFRWWHVLISMALILLSIFALLILQIRTGRWVIGVYLILFGAIGFYIFNARYPTKAQKDQAFVTVLFLLVAATVFKICSPETDVPIYIKFKSYPRADIVEMRRRVTPGLKIGQRQPTVDYWTQTVANLHTTRFKVADETEPSSQYYRRYIKQMLQNLSQARMVNTTNVDVDLREMVKRHLDLDQRLTRLLMQARNLGEKMNVADQPTSIGETIKRGFQFYEQVATDPSKLAGIEDPKVRDLLLRMVELEEARLEQLREIELMQVRLQERYYPGQFPLPDIN